jgi:hypothetical protein
MAIGDIFQVILDQTLVGKNMLNVWFYRATEDNITALDVAVGFDAAIMSDLADVQTTLVNYDALRVRNLFDPADVAEATPSESTGGVTVTGDTNVPNFAALSYVSPRTRGDVRNGYKRIGGIKEEYIEGNIVDPDAVQYSQFLTLAGVFSDDLQKAAADVLQPVIVARIPYEEDGETKYRLPDNNGEAVFAVADNWALQQYITTQNSRKKRG